MWTSPRTLLKTLIADDDGAAVVKALGEGNTEEF